MKNSIISLMTCLLLAGCNGQGGGNNTVGFGVGMSGYNSRFVKLDAHARDTLHDYLASAYKNQCGRKAKHHARSCDLDRPFLTNGSLPVGAATHPLPQNIIDQIGFVPPGTSLVQSGYAVYLIHWPDKIILDSVSLRPYWKESLRG
jgi:hypothetical protein